MLLFAALYLLSAVCGVSCLHSRLDAHLYHAVCRLSIFVVIVLVVVVCSLTSRSVWAMAAHHPPSATLLLPRTTVRHVQYGLLFVIYRVMFPSGYTSCHLCHLALSLCKDVVFDLALLIFLFSFFFFAYGKHCLPMVNTVT